MTSWLDKIVPPTFKFEGRYRHFIKALLCLVVVQLLYFSPFLIEGSGFPADPWTTKGIHKFFHLLELSSSTLLNFSFLILAFGAILLQFKSKLKVLSSIILWFVYVNIINRLNAAETGANSLIGIFLFTHILFNYFELIKSEVGKGMAFRMFQLQVCVIYFVSTVYKLYGDHWMEGAAVSELMLNPIYNIFHPMVFCKELSAIMVYLILVYQLLFPIFIWWKKFKKSIVLIGLALHIGIAILMGLFFFSFVMIISYLLFVDIEILYKKRSLSYLAKRSQKNKA